ncbi:hypothetical protein E2C01_054110 [Portunus trituberculatus]|uniref:Uncharacterized protein n=1 Tax=Portunus trituberculatus TaxID=210409 RepID=A0A5B7GU35_PORTR|nr:hypothetical protein [Portunus trituberculatus]
MCAWRPRGAQSTHGSTVPRRAPPHNIQHTPGQRGHNPSSYIPYLIAAR